MSPLSDERRKRLAQAMGRAAERIDRMVTTMRDDFTESMREAAALIAFNTRKMDVERDRANRPDTPEEARERLQDHLDELGFDMTHLPEDYVDLVVEALCTGRPYVREAEVTARTLVQMKRDGRPLPQRFQWLDLGGITPDTGALEEEYLLTALRRS